MEGPLLKVTVGARNTCRARKEKPRSSLPGGGKACTATLTKTGEFQKYPIYLKLLSVFLPGGHLRARRPFLCQGETGMGVVEVRGSCVLRSVPSANLDSVTGKYDFRQMMFNVFVLYFLICRMDMLTDNGIEN